MFFQVAALTVSQILTLEVIGPTSWVESDPLADRSEASVSRAPRSTSPSLAPLLSQVADMGFSKKAVEIAIKALSKLELKKNTTMVN